MELGKAEGFTAKQMGDMIKEEMLNAGISLRTIQNYLPAEAKGKPRGATTTINLEKKTEVTEEKEKEEEFSANSTQNESMPAPEPNQETQQDQPQILHEPKEHIESPPESPSPPQQHEDEENYEPVTATKYEIKPEDYIIADLPKYDWSLLIEIIKYLDNNASKFSELTSKWQRKYEEYAEEKKAFEVKIRELEEENVVLKSRVSELAGKRKAVESNVLDTKEENPTKKDRPSFETVKKIVRSEAIRTRKDWRNYCRKHPELNLSQKANEVYGISWEDLFGGTKSKSNLRSQPSGVVSALAA